MKGGFSAFFWQGVATIFGANLKSTFNKNGDDTVLENLLNIYENGDYETLYRQVFGMGVEEHAKYMQKKKNKK
jgi:pyruvate dehydrogenase complex dehydrogenase (E1) component